MRDNTKYKDIPVVAELYDYVPDLKNRRDREFYLEYCRKYDGEILELCCGTGRILIPAAESGCKITGIDLSEPMLRRCRDKLEKLPEIVQERVTLVKEDMTEFKLNRLFQLIIAPAHALQHLITEEMQKACLQSVHNHLKSDGLFVFDVFQFNPENIDKPENQNETEVCNNIALPDGRIFRMTHRIAKYYRDKQYSDIELIYYLTENGSTYRHVHSFPYRYYYREEMERLLDQTGFKILDIFSDFNKSPLTPDSDEMIFITGRG